LERKEYAFSNEFGNIPVLMKNFSIPRVVSTPDSQYEVSSPESDHFYNESYNNYDDISVVDAANALASQAKAVRPNVSVVQVAKSLADQATEANSNRSANIERGSKRVRAKPSSVNVEETSKTKTTRGSRRQIGDSTNPIPVTGSGSGGPAGSGSVTNPVPIIDPRPSIDSRYIIDSVTGKRIKLEGKNQSLVNYCSDPVKVDYLRRLPLMRAHRQEWLYRDEKEPIKPSS